MKQFKLTLLIIALLIRFQSQAQKDWSKVDFKEAYKATYKIGGKTSKSLNNNKTFIPEYAISQAMLMKGSQSSSALQSGNPKTVYSRATLTGINQDEYQQMVDNLYKELMESLANSGLIMTDGTDVLASAYAQKQLAKGSDKIRIENTGSTPKYEGKKSVDSNSILAYNAGAGAVLKDVTFPPRNKNIFQTKKKIHGNFYQFLADKEGYNLLFINHKVSFVSFDGARGYKDVNISTQPVISIKTTIKLTNPKGYGEIYFKEAIWGSANWAKDIHKIKSGEYEVIADSDAYIAELKAILSNLQKDIVKNIKEAL